ncbi:MAG: BspA family leucine-rich repeat surface protein [Bacteroidia bacterium]
MEKVKSLLRPFLIIMFTLPVINAQATAFITTWKTDNAGTSSSTQITIPGTGTYTVEWVEVGVPGNNGSTSGTGSVTVNFPYAGTYQVSIPSGMTRIYFNRGGDRLKLLTIEQWGTLAWTSMNRAFYGCANLTYNAVDAPDLSLVTDMHGMFRECANFNGAIGGWDVSTVTNMSYLFTSCSIFNQNIGSWTVSGVSDMSYMFLWAPSFNQDIGGWDVGSVTNMTEMFDGANAFNQDIGSWDVSNVSGMAWMFRDAAAFNQDISGWIVSGAGNMTSMFSGCTNFNQDISGWDVSGISDLSYMFNGCTNFNQDISGWNVSNVYSMTNMFNGATAFDQNLGSWNISNIDMFGGMDGMLNNSGLSRTNYDNTLIGWEAQAVPDLTVDATGLIYCSGETARDALISNGWTINGDTKDCSVFPVEWLNFTAKPQSNTIRLDWGTANELNSDFFAIERSVDQKIWQTLGQVDAAGYSTNTQNYTYKDQQPLTGKTYYRIRQVDLDGSFSTSKIVETTFFSVEAVIYPNPVHNQIFIDIQKNTDASAVIIDMQGRIVKQFILNAAHNSIAVGDLPPGLYLLRVSNDPEWEKEMLVIKE